MSLEKATTSDGLQVYVDTMPERETAKINVFVGVGSVHEPKKLAGISHALEHCVYISTELFPNEKALNEFTDASSLEIDDDTYYIRTCYGATGPYVEPNMKRLGEVLFRATFKDEYIPNELSTIKREAYELRDDIMRVHDIASDYALFGKPYGRSVIGYSDRIAFTSDQLRDFYKRHYTMSNMAIIAVGNVTMEEIMQGVERYFDASHNVKPVIEQAQPQQSKFATSGLLLPNSEISMVRFGSPLDQPFVQKYLDDKPRYETAMGAISRLCYQRFRIDTGLSYDGTASICDINDPVAWSIAGNATVDPADVGKARSMFRDILSHTSDSYSDAAIASAIGASKGIILGSMDSVESRTELYIQDLEHKVEPVDLREVAKAVRSLSPDGVRAAIDEIVEYINVNPPITHISGPKKAIKSADKIFDLNKIA